MLLQATRRINDKSGRRDDKTTSLGFGRDFDWGRELPLIVEEVKLPIIRLPRECCPTAR